MLSAPSPCATQPGNYWGSSRTAGGLLGGNSLFTGASIGVAIYPAMGQDTATL